MESSRWGWDMYACNARLSVPFWGIGPCRSPESVRGQLLYLSFCCTPDLCDWLGWLHPVRKRAKTDKDLPGALERIDIDNEEQKLREMEVTRVGSYEKIGERWLKMQVALCTEYDSWKETDQLSTILRVVEWHILDSWSDGLCHRLCHWLCHWGGVVV